MGDHYRSMLVLVESSLAAILVPLCRYHPATMDSRPHPSSSEHQYFQMGRECCHAPAMTYPKKNHTMVRQVADIPEPETAVHYPKGTLPKVSLRDVACREQKESLLVDPALDRGHLEIAELCFRAGWNPLIE